MSNINQVDDDLYNRGKTYLNQKQNVYPIGDGIPTNASVINATNGTIANPGPSGFGGADQPGRRTFNPLSKLSSYTYNITLYMLTPAAFKTFVENGRTRIDAFSNAKEGAFIIAQSGGIRDDGQNRAPGFELDYFIDDLKWNIACSTNSTGLSSAVNWDMHFKIIEPFGFSFLTNLRTATDYLLKTAQLTNVNNPNAWKQLYVLGIRYYGYDDKGNPVNPTTVVDGEMLDPLGTNGALFESFFDITITGVKFKLGSGANTYEISATGRNSNALLGTKNGRIQSNVNIKGYTVGEAIKDLEVQLNARQEELYNNKSIRVKNQYVLTFAKSAQELAKAKLSTETTRNRFTFVPTSAANTTQSNEAKSQEKPNYGLQRFTFSTDTALPQIFDTIIKRSAYLENAMDSIAANRTDSIDTKKGSPKQEVNPEPQPLTWYTASVNITEATWDDLINDWAYKIEYVFKSYKIPSLPTTVASNRDKYVGAYKRYDYFLTGANSEVLDLQLNFNNLYYMSVLNLNSNLVAVQNLKTNINDAGNREDSTAGGTNSGSADKNTSLTSDKTGLTADQPPATAPSPTTPVATAGGQISINPGVLSIGPKDGQVGVTGSDKDSILTYLNDPSAFAEAKMSILGDPDYLIRDSSQTINDLFNRYYDTNGYTINAAGGQIFIEVGIKQAIDYNEKTGVMPLCQNFYFINHPQYVTDISKGAMIFTVVSVNNSYSGGKFTQTLDLRAATFNGDAAAIQPLQSRNGPPPSVYPNNKWPTSNDLLPSEIEDANKIGVNFNAKNNNNSNQRQNNTLLNNTVVDINGNRIPLTSTVEDIVNNIGYLP